MKGRTTTSDPTDLPEQKPNDEQLSPALASSQELRDLLDSHKNKKGEPKYRNMDHFMAKKGVPFMNFLQRQEEKALAEQNTAPDGPPIRKTSSVELNRVELLNRSDPSFYHPSRSLRDLKSFFAEQAQKKLAEKERVLLEQQASASSFKAPSAK